MAQAHTQTCMDTPHAKINLRTFTLHNVSGYGDNCKRLWYKPEEATPALTDTT